uniref:FAD-dependent oxidoreductase 2 FAD binding domain-containing protein n=1 Tax=Romanomermis culicivorax TaxID=13658 RepID=A0A915J3I1_ROMCU
MFVIFLINAETEIMIRSPSNQTFKNKNIVIIGGGLAGLSAAIEIAKYKGSATVIESQKYTGGNSAKGVSGLNGCMTSAQRKVAFQNNCEYKTMKYGISFACVTSLKPRLLLTEPYLDSKQKFLADTLKAGRNENDEKLANIMVQKSDDAFKFLSEIGVELDEVNIGGGHSVPRTHW